MIQVITTQSKSFEPSLKDYTPLFSTMTPTFYYIVQDNSGTFRAVLRNSSFCFQSALSLDECIARASIRIYADYSTIADLERKFIDYYILLGFKFPLNFG